MAPLLARLGVRTVPLFAALSTRSELHKPGDCLHFCEASEATQHMATAVLAVLAASATSPDDGCTERVHCRTGRH